MGIKPDSDTKVSTVIEVLTVDNYMYVRLDDPDVWMAIPIQGISIGDQVNFETGMEMRDFYSKQLDRTFDAILFVQKISVVGKDVDVMHSAALRKGVAEKREIKKPDSVAAPAPGEITRLAGGKTIAEILAAPDQLNKHTVSLRAKVLKINENINGKNWITLGDGTGTGVSSRLLATSEELVSPGDLVIAKGIVGTDIDIGSGYKYEVLLEQAVFSPDTE
jgi:hypothetical protein